MDLGLNYLVGIWTHLDTLGGVCHRGKGRAQREREREREGNCPFVFGFGASFSQ